MGFGQVDPFIGNAVAIEDGACSTGTTAPIVMEDTAAEWAPVKNIPTMAIDTRCGIRTYTKPPVEQVDYEARCC